MAKKRRTRNKTSATMVAADSPMTHKSQEDWEAKDALGTLVRAHKISSNKDLMKRVKSHAKTERAAHDRVLRLEGKSL